MKKKNLKIVAIVILAIMLVVAMNITTLATEVTAEQENNLLGSIALGAVDGMVGILLLPFKIFIIIIGSVVRLISGGIALIGGTDGLANTIDTIVLSPEDILFNKINLTNINIFDFSVTGAMLSIRQNIAKWYYALRNLSVVVLLVILVYVGFRMALTTVAEEAAKYKKMLKDWLVSFILVFLLHYIIIFTIWISNGLVEVMANSLQESTAFGTAINDVLARSIDVRLTVGLGSGIIYLLLCMLTLVFLIAYIKRMLTVSFLILIAPIITITYSIDKMGDGQSQAVNTWLKEFVYNVMVQPVHCLIYLIFGVTAVGLMNGSLSTSILAIIMIGFILKGENMIKTIFGFKASSLKSATDSAVAVGVGMKLMSDTVSKTAKAAGAVKEGGSSSSKAKSGSVNLEKNANAYAESMGNGGSSSQQQSSQQDSQSNVRQNSGKLAQVGGVLGSKAKTIGKAAATKLSPRKQFEMAMALTGAAPGYLQGDMSSSIAGGTVAYATGKKLIQKHDEKQMQKQVALNEEKFASVYQEYANDTGFSNQEMMDKAKEIIEKDHEDIETRDIKFASYLYSLQDSYAAIGEDDTRKRLLETIDEINNGNIKPKKD